MSKFKTIFHRKSESFPSAVTPQKEDAKADSLHRARTASSTLPSNETRTLRTHRSINFKNYVTSFKSRSFFPLQRAPRPQTNDSTSMSTFSAGKVTNTPITSLFTPRPVPTPSARTGSTNRQTRHHRQYSINLADIPVPQEKASDPNSAIDREKEVFDVGLGSSTDSRFIDPLQGSPLDTVRLARRRSKASRYSTGQSPSSLLAPPHPLSAIPLAILKTSYPPAQSEDNRSCSSLWAPPAYRTRSHSRATANEEESFNADMRPRGSSLRPGSADSDKTALHRAAEILQLATARALADPAFSQSSIFRSLVPLVVFFSLLAIATIVSKYYPLEGRLTSDLTFISSLVVFGVSLTLAILRSCIWVVGVLAKSFCEANLAELFRKRGVVDANGMRMAEGDLVTALF